MSEEINQAIVFGFVEEVESYLPTIKDGLERYVRDNTQVEAIQQSYRLMHTIKGASSMIGLVEISHKAFEAEEILEEYALVQGDMSEETAENLRGLVAQVEQMLRDVSKGNKGHFDADEFNADLLTFKDKETNSVSETAEPFSQTPTDSVTNTEEENISSSSTGLLAIDPEMLEVFSAEAEDHLRTMGSRLAMLEKQPEDRASLQDVRRSVHTLKGAAGVVGLRTIAQLAHRMEDLLDNLYEGQQSATPEIISLLLTSTDVLEALTLGADENLLREDIDALYEGYTRFLHSQSATDINSAIQPLTEPTVIDLTEMAKLNVETIEVEPAEQAKAQRDTGRVVRVPLERVDDLVKLVSELVISRTVLEQRMSHLSHEVEDLRHSTERLRRVSAKFETEYEASSLGGGRFAFNDISSIVSQNIFNPVNATGFLSPQQFEKPEFDELEFDRYTEFHRLSRELSESSSDTNTVGNELTNLLGDFDAIMTRQRRLTSEIQEQLMRLRMVPLSTLTTRLHRTVRVVANQEGKQAELIIEGENIEFDTTVLSEMADPLLHLLRNSVGHGIESPQTRLSLGKPEQGTIRLRAFHEGTFIVIEVSDDGTGLNPAELREKAISGGFISSSEVSAMSDHEALSLIFLPGFSTAKEISELSGRGVGMDVVRERVNKLQGTLTLNSKPKQGVTFTIRLPMTLAVMRALMTKTHGETYAIPLSSVTQILRIEREEIERLADEQVIWINGRLYPVVYLGDALKLQRNDDISLKYLPVLILKTGEDTIALVVEYLLEGREIVIKSLGNHLRRVHGIMGATIMGDGRVIPILNPSDLRRSQAQRELSAQPILSQPSTSTTARKVLNVMIVDDSPSVRRIMSNMIKGAGWQPIMAKDGLDALETLHTFTQLPDVILLDVEMPRMDGYELLAALKAQESYRSIPVVMVTSRTGEKHRKKAFELGVSEYLSKPYNDDVLLNLVRRLAK